MKVKFRSYNVKVKYYLIREMESIIDGQLKNQEELVPICKVPLITSQKEEQALVATTTKVNAMSILPEGQG